MIETMMIGLGTIFVCSLFKPVKIPKEFFETKLKDKNKTDNCNNVFFSEKYIDNIEKDLELKNRELKIKQLEFKIKQLEDKLNEFDN